MQTTQLDKISHKEKLTSELLDILSKPLDENNKQLRADYFQKLKADKTLTHLEKLYLLQAQRSGNTNSLAMFLTISDSNLFKEYLELLGSFQNGIDSKEAVYLTFSLIKSINIYSESLTMLIISNQPTENIKLYLQLLNQLMVQGVSPNEILSLFTNYTNPSHSKQYSYNALNVIILRKELSAKLEMISQFLLELLQRKIPANDVFVLFQHIVREEKNFGELLADKNSDDAIILYLDFLKKLLEKDLDPKSLRKLLNKNDQAFGLKLVKNLSTKTILAYFQFILDFNSRNNTKIVLHDNILDALLEKKNYNVICFLAIYNLIPQNCYSKISSHVDALFAYILTLEADDKQKAFDYLSNSTQALAKLLEGKWQDFVEKTADLDKEMQKKQFILMANQLLGKTTNEFKESLPDFLKKLKSNTVLTTLEKIEILMIQRGTQNTIGLICASDINMAKIYIDLLLSFLQEKNASTIAFPIFALLKHVENIFSETFTLVLNHYQPLVIIKEYLQLLNQLMNHGIGAKSILSLYAKPGISYGYNSLMAICIRAEYSETLQICLQFLIELVKRDVCANDIFPLLEHVDKNGKNCGDHIIEKNDDGIIFYINFLKALVENGLELNAVSSLLAKNHSGSTLTSTSQSTTTLLNYFNAALSFTNKKESITEKIVNILLNKKNFELIYFLVFNNLIPKNCYEKIAKHDKQLFTYILTLEQAKREQALQLALDVAHPLGNILQKELQIHLQDGSIPVIYMPEPYPTNPVIVYANDPNQMSYPPAEFNNPYTQAIFPPVQLMPVYMDANNSSTLFNQNNTRSSIATTKDHVNPAHTSLRAAPF